jgi:hypothetical protein
MLSVGWQNTMLLRVGEPSTPGLVNRSFFSIVRTIRTAARLRYEKRLSKGFPELRR